MTSSASLDPVAFPLLLPQDKKCESYSGSIIVQKQEFFISISSKGTDSFALSTDDRLKHLLKDQDKLLQQRWQQCKNLSSFLVELETIIERLLSSSNSVLTPLTTESTNSDFCVRILSELGDIGWKSVVDVNLSQSPTALIKLKLYDKQKREHLVTMKIKSNDYPRSAPVCSADLPAIFEPKWNSEKGDLSFLTNQYQEMINAYSDFWDVMDDWDTNTWVLDPAASNRTRAFTTRRIAIGSHCSLQVTVDCKLPRSVCECRFLGTESVVQGLRQKLNAKVQTWNQKQLPRQNLEAILELKFPSASAAQRQDDLSVECAICYAYHFTESIPDQMCENPKCARPFHRECLYDWFKMQTTTRQSFNTLFGICPYCSNPITITAP
eukprot:TRINITY_DN7800_c0_g1_i1.p1 TRINITY_DN7800_c0_g1~~TRINITY_DN7800_c0_g1_i1.p1  ORF type:complete len:381 (+),score=48.76 TRINITY_DN7800_c0_g1_i1:114-1256(+)